MRECLAVVLALAWCLGAAEHRVLSHPRAPFEVKAIAEGSDGFLYVGGNEGLLRYDGYRYVKVAGYPLREVTQLVVGEAEELWALSSGEGVARERAGEPGKFDVVERGAVRGLLRLGPSVMYESNDAPALVVWRKGHSQRRALQNSVYVLPKANGGALATANGAVYEVDENGAMRWRKREPGAILGTVDGEGKEWFLYLDKVVGEGSGQRQEIRLESKRWDTLTLGRRGQVWLKDGTKIWGLSPRIEFARLPEVAISIYEDARGHVWAGSAQGGLWELVADEGRSFWSVAGLGGGAPRQVLEDAKGRIFVVTTQGIWTQSGKQWRQERPSALEVRYALVLGDGRWLASVRQRGLAWLGRDGPEGSIPGSDAELYRNDFRKLVELRPGSIRAASRNGLFEAMESGLRRVALPGEGQDLVSQALDVVQDREGKWLVGYREGIARESVPGQWERLSSEPPLRDVASVAPGRKGELWVSFRREVGFARWQAGQVKLFRPEDGYGNERTLWVKVDSRGWVWRGTEAGVWVADGEHLAARDWLRVEEIGEAAQYGFFEDRQGAVWLAGAQGVVRLQPQKSWFLPEKEPPRLSRIWQAGREVERMPDEGRQLRLEFARPRNWRLWPHALEYRIAPLEEGWREAQEGVVQVDLASGQAYEVQVRQSGRGEVWRQRFGGGSGAGGIGKQTALLAGLVILALGGVWIYWRRDWLTYRLEKEKWWYLRGKGQFPQRQGEAWNGKILGNGYILEELISTGGFSQVYAARREGGEERYAVKVIAGRTGDVKWLRDRFSMEVAALQMVRHPGVVRLVEAWIEVGGEPCLAMEMVEGRTLREYLVAGERDPEREASIVQQLGQALAAVHRVGVVHRDLKPENIILREDGRVVLVDFGTSGLLGVEEERTKTKLLAGSLDYLAPERLTGYYSAASDVFSLGVIVVELLTGQTLSETGVGKQGPLLPGYGDEKLRQLVAAAVELVPEQRPPEVAAWASAVAERMRGWPAKSA
ncbi:MAG: protein kinase [Bryobacter sp.]|nr:protein kinase [Bryobacter sp.]